MAIEREPVTFRTAYGYGALQVTGDDQGHVVVTMNAEAAQVLARIVGVATAMGHDMTADDLDVDAWCGITVDLLATAALVASPPVATAGVSGYIPPRSRRP